MATPRCGVGSVRQTIQTELRRMLRGDSIIKWLPIAVLRELNHAGLVTGAEMMDIDQQQRERRFGTRR